MDLNAFEASPVGTLVPISGTDPRTGNHFDHKAFLPAGLPLATPNLAPETWAVVSQAALALGRLDQAGRQIPNPGLLKRPSIRREAVSTSALEGTYAPFAEVLEADVDEETPSSPAVREILNYVRIADSALDYVKERPISVRMLCELQAVLVKGTSGETADAGRVREVQVVIGHGASGIEEARFVPPPPGDQLLAGFQEWESWLQADHGIDPVVAVAMSHYQFETLHPFNDGNGRLGRLIVVLHLLRAEVLREGLVTISPWLEQRRSDYQDRLLRVSQTGDFDPWVRFMSEGLRARADVATAQVERLLAIQESMRDLVRTLPLRGVGADIAQDLIGIPVVTSTSSSKRYGVSYQAANSGIARLVEAGVLREVTGRSYGRVFLAEQVLKAIEA
ncbi:MAG: Fic family protein [Actinomycetota bacterium]